MAGSELVVRMVKARECRREPSGWREPQEASRIVSEPWLIWRRTAMLMLLSEVGHAATNR